MNEKILIIAVGLLLLTFHCSTDDFSRVQKKPPNCFFYKSDSRSDRSEKRRPSRRLFINDFFSSLPDRAIKFEYSSQRWAAPTYFQQFIERILIERKVFDLLRDIFGSSSSKWKSNHGRWDDKLKNVGGAVSQSASHEWNILESIIDHDVVVVVNKNNRKWRARERNENQINGDEWKNSSTANFQSATCFFFCASMLSCCWYLTRNIVVFHSQNMISTRSISDRDKNSLWRNAARVWVKKEAEMFSWN